MCSKVICENINDYCSAAWSLIYAAWTLDDANDVEQAHRVRLDAIKMVGKAHRHGQTLLREKNTDALIVTDLLRRTAQFDKAKTLAVEHLNKIESAGNRQMLEKQIQLSDALDIAVHKCPDLS